AETKDQRRIEQRQLGLEPDPAGGDLAGAGWAVLEAPGLVSGRAAADDVREPDVGPRQGDRGEPAVEEVAGGAAERQPGAIVSLGGAPADDGERGGGGAGAEDDAPPRQAQVAARTVGGRRSRLLE